MYDRGLARAVGEGALAGGREAAVVAGRHVDGLDAGHAGDVDDARGGGRGGALEEERLEPDGHVEDGFDVERHELVPAGFGEVVVGGAPGGARVVWARRWLVTRLVEMKGGDH